MRCPCCQPDQNRLCAVELPGLTARMTLTPCCSYHALGLSIAAVVLYVAWLIVRAVTGVLSSRCVGGRGSCVAVYHSNISSTHTNTAQTRLWLLCSRLLISQPVALANLGWVHQKSERQAGCSHDSSSSSL